jgi:hypothetical protein
LIKFNLYKTQTKYQETAVALDIIYYLKKIKIAPFYHQASAITQKNKTTEHFRMHSVKEQQEQEQFPVFCEHLPNLHENAAHNIHT